MNFEFRSAGSPSRNGIVGLSSTLSGSYGSQSDTIQQGMVFKDLLNQSRSSVSQKQQSTTTEQDDANLEKVYEQNSKAESGLKAVSKPDKAGDDEFSEPEDLKLKDSQKSEDGVQGQKSDGSQLNSRQTLQNGMEAVAMLNFKVPMSVNEQGNPEGSELEDGQLGMSAIETDMGLTQSIPGGALALDQLLVNNQSRADEAVALVGKQTAEAGADMIQPFGESGKFGQLVKEMEATETLSEIKPNDNSQQMAVANPDDAINPEALQDQSQQQGVSEETGEQNRSMSSGSENILQSAVMAESDSTKSEDSTSAENNTQDLGLRGLHSSNATEVNHIKGTEVPVKAAVAQQVEQKILQNYEVNKPVVFQMTLSPDNLGDIDVQMQYSNGKLIIDIAAASQDTQNLLGKQIDQLVKGLNLQNVQVESVHLNKAVEAGNSSQNASFTMDSSSDFSQQQNNSRLRESFLRNANIQQSLLQSATEGSDDSIQGIAQSMYYTGQRRINYLV